MSKEELKSKIRDAIENGPLGESINKLSIFGSYARDEAHHESDVDILVEFSPDAVVGFFALSEFKEYIEKKLGKKVDLLTPDSISRYLKEDIVNQSYLVYER